MKRLVAAAVGSLLLGGVPAAPVLYVGGTFTKAGSMPRRNLAAIGLSDGFVLGFDARPNGSDLLSLVAKDSAGNRSKPVRVLLTITRSSRHTRGHTPSSEDRSRLPVEEN